MIKNEIFEEFQKVYKKLEESNEILKSVLDSPTDSGYSNPSIADSLVKLSHAISISYNEITNIQSAFFMEEIKD